jgi:uncharacterized iron-regulated membrane protein
MPRGFLFQLHLWAGLILCLPIVVIALTGRILVFVDALDYLTNPPLPVPPWSPLPVVGGAAPVGRAFLLIR